MSAYTVFETAHKVDIIASWCMCAFVFILWPGDVLDKAVSDVYHNTPCPCAQCTGPKNNSGYVIGIALVRKMETDSESQSVSVDENTSG